MEQSAVRRVLDGVPRVAFYGDMMNLGYKNLCPEDMPLPACLRSLAEYLGEDWLGCRHRPQPATGTHCECGYAYFMGACGQGFSLNWNRNEWDHGNGNVLYLTDDALDPVRWGLEAIGYGFSSLGNADHDRERLFPERGDEEAMRREIKASIDRGLPVLGFGVVGPPECCLITGYDEEAAVLIGWSFFQGFPEFAAGLEFEEAGYFRKRDWYHDTVGIVVLGEKTGRPDLGVVYARSLRRGLGLMRSEMVRDRFTAGTAACDAWIAAILDDDAFGQASAERLGTMYQIHNDAVGNVAEYRCYAADFLSEAAKVFPQAADEIEQAAGCFKVQHDLMWRVWERLGGHPEYTKPDEEPAVSFARPEARRRIADVLRIARDRDAEAAAHLETALRIVDEKPAVFPAQVAPRAVLEDVPYTGLDTSRTDGQQRHTWVCAAMHSALEYLGEPYSYSFLMGVSGAAFRLAWNVERWDGGNISTLNMGDDPTEHIRRMFRAVGWVPDVLGNPLWRDGIPADPPTGAYRGPDYLGTHADFVDEVAMRERVMRDLRFKRYPLITVGTMLPPDCGLICGYDDGGDVLIGWHLFQGFLENVESDTVGFEPDGRFRKRNWYQDTVGLVAFSYKTPKPTPAQSYRSAIEWALKLGRTPRFRLHWSGLASYDAWAGALEDESQFQDLDEEARFARLMCHNDAMIGILEGRANAVDFLRAAAKALPQAEDALAAAVGAYEAEIQTVGAVADVLGGVRWDAEAGRQLVDGTVRARIATLIRQARRQESEALDSLARALDE